jgi:hypothetical protein
MRMEASMPWSKRCLPCRTRRKPKVRMKLFPARAEDL